MHIRPARPSRPTSPPRRPAPRPLLPIPLQRALAASHRSPLFPYRPLHHWGPWPRPPWPSRRALKMRQLRRSWRRQRREIGYRPFRRCLTYRPYPRGYLSLRVATTPVRQAWPGSTLPPAQGKSLRGSISVCAQAPRLAVRTGHIRLLRLCRAYHPSRPCQAQYHLFLISPSCPLLLQLLRSLRSRRPEEGNTPDRRPSLIPTPLKSLLA